MDKNKRPKGRIRVFNIAVIISIISTIGAVCLLVIDTKYLLLSVGIFVIGILILVYSILLLVNSFND